MRTILSSKLLVMALLIIFCRQNAQSQIVINEWSASNTSTIQDNYGDYSDWIELYNTTGSAVNITGFNLSDNVNNIAKWTFTSGTIPANGKLLVWASGQNIIAGSNYHTNFKLTQTKPEKIILSNASSVVLDSFTMRPAQNNHSRGRVTDGATTWGVFTTPTPNAVNANVMQEYSTKPTMSVNAGFYTSTQTVSIATPDPNTTIYYTTNGNVPTSSSTIYSGPITVSVTTVLRAVGINSNTNIPSSFIESNTIFINSSHTIPVISLFGNQVQTLLNGTQINAIAGIEYFNAAGQIRAESEGTTNEHGNDSWAYSQRGIDFICRDEYGYKYALTDQLFPAVSNRNEFQRLVIKAGANDNYPDAPPNPPTSTGGAHIRDAYVHTLSQLASLQMDERSSVFCIMYVNGQYWGVYDLREKADDSDYTDYYYDQDEPNIQYLKTWGATWSEYGGAQAQTDWNTLVNFVTGNNMAIQANYDYVDSVYNIKSLVDYFVLNAYIASADWLNWNTAWWRGRDLNGNHKKWGYVLWDMDATFGHYIDYTGIGNQTPQVDPCNPEGLGDPGGQGHVPILNALLNNATFEQYYISRFIDLANTSFSCTYLINVLDSMVNVIAPEMPQHCQRWGGSVSGWQTNVTSLKTWINQRCAALSQGLINCYQITGPYPLVFNVDPPLSGTIKINSYTPSIYEFRGNYYGNINILLKADANSGYSFDRWELQSTTITPSINDSSGTILITSADSIIAHFITLAPPPPPPPPPPVEGEVMIPNGFSPNGDGQNDILFVLGTNVANFELTIFNRWGEKVFFTNDQQKGWDGVYKGQKLNSGVFAYILNYTQLDGGKFTKNGNISLVR